MPTGVKALNYGSTINVGVFAQKRAKKNARRLLYPLSLNCRETKKG
ncbi:hypothetical protein [Halalkalibacterium halodurans]|nr:hypothetical protein [Halalkalibacterium halodurans]